MKSNPTQTGPTDLSRVKPVQITDDNQGDDQQDQGPDLDPEQLGKLADRLEAVVEAVNTRGDKSIMDLDALSEAAQLMRELAASVEPAQVAEARRWAGRLLSASSPARRQPTRPLREGKRPAAPPPPGSAESWARRLLG
jgi:hypothetical protein